MTVRPANLDTLLDRMRTYERQERPRIIKGSPQSIALNRLLIVVAATQRGEYLHEELAAERDNLEGSGQPTEMSDTFGDFAIWLRDLTR